MQSIRGETTVYRLMRFVLWHVHAIVRERERFLSEGNSVTRALLIVINGLVLYVLGDCDTNTIPCGNTRLWWLRHAWQDLRLACEHVSTNNHRHLLVEHLLHILATASHEQHFHSGPGLAS